MDQQQSLQPQQQHPNTALIEFHAGVTAVLRTWSAFKTAVIQQWGGIDSHSKAETLRSHIFQHYNGQANMEVYDLEDNLALFMEEEFSLVLEDDSECQVANAISNMYQQCSQGEFTLVREMVTLAERLRLQDNGSVQHQAQIINLGELDDDENESEEDDQITLATDTNTAAVPTTLINGSNRVNHSMASVSVTITSNTILEYALSPLFNGGLQPKKTVAKEVPPTRQLGEHEPEKPSDVAMMDEDGFAVVTSNRRNRKY